MKQDRTLAQIGEKTNTVLFIMIGPPGCGKTTLGERIARETGSIMVSSDAIRAELYGDETIQKDPKKIFSIAYSRLIETGENGFSAVFDATNCSPFFRTRMFEAVQDSFQSITGIVYDGTLVTCREQNAARERKVPIDVISSMYTSLLTDPPSLLEGFDSLMSFTEAEKRLANGTL